MGSFNLVLRSLQSKGWELCSFADFFSYNWVSGAWRRLLSQQTPEIWVLCLGQLLKGSPSSFPGFSYPPADNLKLAAASLTL